MKKVFIIISLFLFLAGCNYNQQSEFPILKGSYLGQTTPGSTPQVFAPSIISTANQDICISVTPDRKEVYFTVGGPPHSVILFMKETEDGWTEPRIAPFSGKYSSECQLSPDGNTMYFCAGIPDSGSGDPKGNWDIWAVEKSNGTWGDAVRLPAPLASGEYSADCPTVAANGNLYFYSANYPGGFGRGDIYISKLIDGKYSQPENLGGAINTEHYDMDPFIAPDESYLVFSSAKPGGYGANDLYISFHNEDGTWSEAQNLGETINSYAHEIHPFVTRDGKYLFFCSTRRIPYERYSDPPLTYEQKTEWLKKPGNEFEDIYWIDADVIEKLKDEK